MHIDISVCYRSVYDISCSSFCGFYGLTLGTSHLVVFIHRGCIPAGPVSFVSPLLSLSHQKRQKPNHEPSCIAQGSWSSPQVRKAFGRVGQGGGGRFGHFAVFLGLLVLGFVLFSWTCAESSRRLVFREMARSSVSSILGCRLFRALRVSNFKGFGFTVVCRKSASLASSGI